MSNNPSKGTWLLFSKTFLAYLFSFNCNFSNVSKFILLSPYLLRSLPTDALYLCFKKYTLLYSYILLYYHNNILLQKKCKNQNKYDFYTFKIVFYIIKD